MKIKIQPAGKAIIFLIALLFLYIILKATGVLSKLPSLSTKFEEKGQSQAAAVTDQKNLARPISIGFSNYNFSPVLYYANGGNESGENSIFLKKHDVKIKLVEKNDDEKTIDLFLKGGENSGIDIMLLRLDQLLTNYTKIEPINPAVFLLTEKKDARNFIIARSYIKTPKLLLGRKIAVQKNSSSYLYLLDFLAKNAIMKNDVNIILTENDQEAFSKTKSRYANVCVISDINLYKELRKERDYIDLTWKTSLPNPQVAIVQRSFLSEHYATFKSITEAYFEASDSISKNPPVSIGVLTDYYKLKEKTDPDIFAKYNPATYSDNFKFFCIDEMNNEETFPKMVDKVKMIMNRSEMFKLFINPKDIQYSEIIKEISAKYKVDYSSKEPVLPPARKEVKEREVITHVNVAKNYKVDTLKKKSIMERPLESADKRKFSLFFAPNESKMDSITRRSLYTFVKNLGEFKYIDFDISGNTDSTGEDKYNFLLSQWRAESVAEYLKASFKISKEKMKIFGKGSKNPIGSNKEEKGKRKNRRVDIEIKTR